MTAAEHETAIRHRYADLGDVRLHYVEAGTGPMVVLLHGFPEFWYSWRHQLPALAAAGFHAVAPDMRGYNLSDKPPGVASYGIDLLTRDVARLIRACGEERAAAVVGHDWGAIVAWLFAMRYPEMLDRLVIMNVPHPVWLVRGIRSAAQLRRSWYVFFFQLSGLPEAMLSAGNFRALRRLFATDTIRPGAFLPEDIERYVEAFAQPGALTSAINYYRALVRQHPFGRNLDLRRIDIPVLVIWGEHDRALGIELSEPPREWVPNARLVRLPDASHWVQNDRPERVNQLLLDFLAPLQ
jgi:pimeloyl-ACP methyl ester carboxylesterase